MKKTLCIGFLTSCLLYVVSGCSDWLDVQPYDKIAEEELFKSEEGFKKLLNGVYLDLNEDDLYGKTLGIEMVEVMGGAYTIGTDQATWGNYIDLSKYEYDTEYWRGRLDAMWDKVYASILNCNKILENMATRKELFTDNNYNIIQGEALALRAMLHFDMLRMFGPVYSRHPEQSSIPYYVHQSMSPGDLLPASEVIDLVVKDLKDARVALANDPILTEGTLMNGTLTGEDNFLCYRALRLNYYAVTGLLARVCLYAGNKSDAFAYATEVIDAANKGIFPFVKSSSVIGTNDPDRIFSTEVLFALSHASRNLLFKNNYDPARLPDYVFRMDNGLMDKYIFGGGLNTGGNQSDYRYRANWTATGNNKYFYKYADMNDTGSIENTMIPMLRLGEMYLIAAESQSDDLSAGVSYINILRKSRDTDSLTSLDQDKLIYEYIRELYGEGQLFYMYKRLFVSVLFSSKASQNPEPSDAIFVVPLPDSETENRQ